MVAIRYMTTDHSHDVVGDNRLYWSVTYLAGHLTYMLTERSGVCQRDPQLMCEVAKTQNSL